MQAEFTVGQIHLYPCQRLGNITTDGFDRSWVFLMLLKLMAMQLHPGSR